MESLSRSDLIKTIERYQYSIQHVNPPESDAQRVLHYIRKLSKLPIKLGELEKTGIGKTINALRKCQGTLGDEAGLLVGKWKAIAKQEVQEEEEECESRKRNGADSNSDYESPDSEYKSTVSKSSKKIKLDVEKVQAEKSIKEIKLKPSKDKVQSSNDRKRKYSEKDKHERKGKYVKLEPTSPSEDECPSSSDEIVVKKEVSRKAVKVDDKHRDSDKRKKKDKDNHDDDKLTKKEHDKKHHKSSKHKEDKDHHRHHSSSKSSSSYTEKKRDSKSDSEKHRERDKKKHSSKSSHDSDRKSSNSSRKDSKSSSKYSTNGPSAVGENDSDNDHYDNSPVNQTDDDFGAALLGISHAVSPAKKKSTPKYSSSIHSSPATNSSLNSCSELDVLSNAVKLEPLDDIDLQVDKLKEETYKSRGDIIRDRSSLRLKEISEAEALNSMTTTKNQRTKVFSGGKSRFTVKLPTLFELCVRILQDNFDSLEYTGGVPYDVLKPILEKVTVEQLYTFENYNPYLIGETDELWEYHAKRHFRHAKRQELETWRDVYLRCVEEREEKLQSLTENISQNIANSTPVRKTKLAYCDTHVKPPRNVARSQAKHGTGNISVMKRSPKGPQPSAAAVQSVKERLAQESLAAPQAVSLASPRNQLIKKKKAPLMQKSLQLLKGLKR